MDIDFNLGCKNMKNWHATIISSENYAHTDLLTGKPKKYGKNVP